MFTPEQRSYARDYVLALASSDPRITAGALTGSAAAATGDGWSDVDLAFGIADGVSPETVLDDWAEVFTRELGALHHWDLRAGSSVYRVFLLPGGLELDVGATPERDFGARGPSFRTLFGATRPPEPEALPPVRYLIGLGWHHVLHARSSIERGKPWRAEHWISAIRDQTIALACLRLGENPYYGRGADNLPDTVTAPLAGALVRSLDEAELRRALSAATSCLIAELDATDPALCEHLRGPLQEFGSA